MNRLMSCLVSLACLFVPCTGFADDGKQASLTVWVHEPSTSTGWRPLYVGHAAESGSESHFQPGGQAAESGSESHFVPVSHDAESGSESHFVPRLAVCRRLRPGLAAWTAFGADGQIREAHALGADPCAEAPRWWSTP